MNSGWPDGMEDISLNAEDTFNYIDISEAVGEFGFRPAEI